jgi:hypothetical protein
MGFWMHIICWERRHVSKCIFVENVDTVNVVHRTLIVVAFLSYISAYNLVVSVFLIVKSGHGSSTVTRYWSILWHHSLVVLAFSLQQPSQGDWLQRMGVPCTSYHKTPKECCVTAFLLPRQWRRMASKGGLHCLHACEENNKTPFSNLPKNLD